MSQRPEDPPFGAGVLAPTGGADGPLGGLLVIDFTRVLAGPFATMMLADLGARVIKVEHPRAGDDSRGYGPFGADGRSLYFARVNRGKESIAIDLKDPADVAVARQLCARADVVVENYRPGVMSRLGLGAPELLAANPKLVVCSISGFGQTGPWAQRPAYDAVVQAMSGLMAITGPAGVGQVKAGTSVSDLSAGLYAFGGITAALLAASRTGRGTHLDVAMYDATVSLLEGAALRQLNSGEDPTSIGNAHFSIAPFDTFACADRSIAICAANDDLFAVLAQTLGRPDLARADDYASNALRHRNRAAMKVEIEAALGTRTAQEWLVDLELVGLPCGPISTVAEAMQSPQTAARRMVISAGGLPAPGQPLKFAGVPDPLERVSAPALDEHGPAIRAEVAALT